MKINLLAGMLLVSAISVRAQDTRFEPRGQQIPAPDYHVAGIPVAPGLPPDPWRIHEVWLADIQHWRTERRIRVGYDRFAVRHPRTSTGRNPAFIQPQMMVQDRYFYDPVAGRYTVDRYLDDLQKRYGGIDAVLIWPTYPNMGIDNRNQHDMIRPCREELRESRRWWPTSIAAGSASSSP